MVYRFTGHHLIGHVLCIYPSERAPWIPPCIYLYNFLNDEILPEENTIGVAGLQNPRLIH